jgi:hypothetical protein
MKNTAGTILAGAQPDNPNKSQSLAGHDSTSKSNRRSSKDAESVPEQVNQFQLQSAQGSRSVSTAERGVFDNRDLASTAMRSLKPPITTETERGAANRQSGKRGGATEGNSPSSPSGTAGNDNPFTRPNAGTASIRKAERKEDGKSGASTLSGTQANPGGKLSAGQAGLLALKPIPSGNNAASSAEQSWDYPARWSASERALAKEKMPPGLKSYIAEYFKAIHP